MCDACVSVSVCRGGLSLRSAGLLVANHVVINTGVSLELLDDNPHNVFFSDKKPLRIRYTSCIHSSYMLVMYTYLSTYTHSLSRNNPM